MSKKEDRTSGGRLTNFHELKVFISILNHLSGDIHDD